MWYTKSIKEGGYIKLLSTLSTIIPTEYRDKFNSKRITNNYLVVLIISISILIVQLGVFAISLNDPFTNEMTIINIYNSFYLTYICINVTLIALLLVIKKLKSKHTILLSMTLAIQVVLLNQWAMGVAIADLFQGEEIVVYFLSMFILAIFIDVSATEFAFSLLINFVLFCLALWSVSSQLNPASNVRQTIIATSQFILFSSIIRYIIDQLTRKNFIYQCELMKLNEELQFLSFYDPLSKIYNRRKFESEYQTLFEQAIKMDKTISISIFDIDFFKQFNDHYGHVNGDKVITDISYVMKDVFKDEGIVYGRYGGDEFIIVFFDKNDQKNTSLLKQLVNNVTVLEIPHKKSVTSKYVTISTGYYSGKPTDIGQMDEFIIEADLDLYSKKSNRSKKTP